MGRCHMTNRGRMHAIIAGQHPDRVPWVPRLEIWYEAHRRLGTLPDEYKGWSLREIEQDLGVGTPARAGKVFRTELHGVETRVRERGDEIITEYITPVGVVSTSYRCSEDLARVGIRGQEVEHIIKGPEDYAPVEYLIQDTDVIPTYDEYLAYEEEIGDNGVPLVCIGQDPMNRILQKLIGYNQAYFHLHDYPRRVYHLFEVLKEHAAKIQRIVLDSPAKLILHGEHFDSMMTPPPIFQEYMVPYFQSFAERLHERDKTLACHADADTSLLLELIKKAGFGMVECFVTAPMVPVTLEQARAVFGKDVIIWGGIPSVMLCDPVSDDEFEEYVLNLFRVIAPGDAFILGVADNVMPEAKLERIRWVSEMVEECGEYPIRRFTTSP